MSLAILALISVAGLAGPLLGLSRRWGLPVVVGELVAGVALGSTGLGVLHATDPTFTFLANLGFALVMFVAGSHVPIRDPALREAVAVGAQRAILVGAAAVPVAFGIARGFHTGHVPLYVVLLASSSAALILPIIDTLHLTGTPILRLLPQVAIADAACIVALPLAIDPGRAGRSALGALAVIGCSVVLYAVLRLVERRGWRRRMHKLSERRRFALELRLSLALLFGLAALAQATRVSIMLAGFCFGLAVAAVGEPRRLARQLFALTEGFLGPVFFVWLGASLDLAALADRPALIGLGVALGLGAALTHLATRVTGQPAALGALASAQLGVPVAAATLGTQAHLLANGEPAALILGALITIAVATAAALLAARTGPVTTPDPTGPPG
ncbi:cation:proton antiporter [Frankia sp. AgB1.9]|uniref:cation:proton antiporter n=1 Tax=unclassified Frankia TaxID=2632575 RepID=UPI001934A823|nr:MULTISPECIES: cation:proton antiporter [unclassified Frankia]MBL7494685.1 cation:proton antiporter [Frankia sp. AgW1.1]MBL7553656.1 cation:proton antiporter [Frankia sp. AgB1.9]MBL7617669.1 cation:proton antiporter [Frankia sp. AgB1.8]